MNYNDIMKRTQDGMISTDKANQELLILGSQMQEKADRELMIIKEEISNNKFIVQTNEPNVKISWQVTSVRNDKYAQQNRIEPEQIKKDNEKGKYLHPEVYGKSKSQRTQPISRGVSDETLKRKFKDGNRKKIEKETIKDVK